MSRAYGLVCGAALGFGLIDGIDHATHGHVGAFAAFLIGLGSTGLGGLIGGGEL